MQHAATESIANGVNSVDSKHHTTVAQSVTHTALPSTLAMETLTDRAFTQQVIGYVASGARSREFAPWGQVCPDKWFYCNVLLYTIQYVFLTYYNYIIPVLFFCCLHAEASRAGHVVFYQPGKISGDCCQWI